MTVDEEHYIFKKGLAAKLKAKDAKIQAWFTDRKSSITLPIYSSVDIRDSGHKIAPVDSNLYPAGFNNICPEDLRTSPKVFRDNLKGIRKLLIIPEFHTANLYYLENLHYLKQILTEAGIEIRIGWNPETPLKEPLHLKSVTEKELLFENFTIENGRAVLGDFTPDMVLLNNDFSGGYPAVLDSITEQPVLPSHKMGWHTRKKSEHFRHYNRLITELSEILDMDPWMFTIASTEVSPVNFEDGTGVEAVITAAETIFKESEKKYAQYGMDQKPFVFVKNNSGTYGMGIMVVHSIDELRTMNRRTKNKMSTGKNKSQISSGKFFM